MKSQLSWERPRNAGFASLLLLGLVSMSETVGSQTDTVKFGPETGLIVYVERNGAKMRILRQLPPATTTTTTPATTASSSPVSSSTSTVSSATTVTPPPMQTTAEVTIFLSELRELDAKGNGIKQNDSSLRSFKAFNDLNFNVTVLPDTSNSKIRSATLKADAALPAPFLGSVVSIEAYVAKENGTVAVGDETMTLTKGQPKFNFEVRGWQWCDGACALGQSAAAKFLEVDFVIQVAIGRSVKDASQDQSYGYPERFSLGSDASADFSRKINVDGSWRNLTDGYPRLSAAGSGAVVTVRIPRFNSSARYDVSFDPGYEPYRGGGPVGCAKVILPQLYNLLLTSLSLVLVKMIA